MTTSAEIYAAAKIVREMPVADWASTHTYGRLMDWASTTVVAEARFAVDLGVAQIIADAVDGDPTHYLDAVPALRRHFTQQGDAQVTEHPATIPADATGLKGRRAKIIGPLTSSQGDWPRDGGYPVGSVVTLASDTLNKNGDIEFHATGTFGGLLRIAASSLALIPETGHGCDGSARCKAMLHVHGCFADTGDCYDPGDHPVAVPEPQVGTRLRDKDGDVWEWDGEYWVCPRTYATHESVHELADEYGPLHQVWTDRNDIPEGIQYESAKGIRVRRENRATPDPNGPFDSPFVSVVPYMAAESDQ